MGAGWRRWSEELRQKWNLGEKDFIVTPNTRNEMMLKEAGEFASHLKRCEKDIRALKNATEDLFITSKVVMASPLPRVYEETGGGKVVPVNAGAAPTNSGTSSQGTGNGAPPRNTAAGILIPIGGTDFNAEEIGKIAKETGKKLESEVLAPMERWTNAFSLVQNRMKKLEVLRLEVDSRRRTVAKLGKKVDMQRAKLPQTRARGEYEMENTIKVLQHKEAKLSACRQSFKEHEALVYHQLTNLIRDTVWLKSYLSAVLRVETEAFQSANVALGTMKAALPTTTETVDLHSSMEVVPDAIPAARADGAAPTMIAASGITRGIAGGKGLRLTSDNGESVAYGGGVKDSLYTLGDDRQAAAAYDRYGVADSTYSRNPVPAW